MAVSRFAGPTSLRQLLDAVVAIGSDLDLEATLRRIIEAATTLVDAATEPSASSTRSAPTWSSSSPSASTRRPIAPSGSSPRATASSVC